MAGASRSRPLIKTHWPWEPAAPGGGAAWALQVPGHVSSQLLSRRSLGSLLSPRRRWPGRAACALVSQRGRWPRSSPRGEPGRDTALPPNCQPLKVNDSKVFENGKTQRFSVLT